MIYFDNAATSHPKPPGVADAVMRAIAGFGNPSRGAHAFAMAAARTVERARTLAAALFGGVPPERVAFTKNVTEALNIAIASIRGHIVTTEAEHNAVLRPLHRRGGFTVVPVDERGCYAVSDIAKACRPDSAAVVVAHASNLTGNIAPIEEIGRFCRERGLLLVVDAAQTAGLVDIDMDAMHIDALCFTGHKSLYGIQGVGGLCAGGRFSPVPVVVGGSGSRTFEIDQPPEMPGVLEAGTMNAHGLAAFAAGLEYVMAHGPAHLLESANRHARRFYEGVRTISGVTLYGDYASQRRVPIVTLAIGGMDSGEVAAELEEEYGMAVRAGAHCAPLLHRRFGTAEQGAVRFSFSHCNTEAETEKAVEAIHEIAKKAGTVGKSGDSILISG